MPTTTIQWTDATWNPVTGCTRVSPGCAHCYIERTPPLRMAGRRFENVNGAATTGVRIHRDRLDQPLRWRKPRRVFVCSLADLFHDDVDEAEIRDVFSTMARAPQHTFQVLTKRPERARRLFERGVLASRWVTEWPLPNVWLGVSIENARYTWRADTLREIPAAVRFISAEPLLGRLFETRREHLMERLTDSFLDPSKGRSPLNLGGIDWVIVGGESGPGARRTDPEWIYEILWHREGHGCAVFMKQLGAVLARERGYRDAKGGNWDEWPADLRIREYPRSAA